MELLISDLWPVTTGLWPKCAKWLLYYFSCQVDFSAPLKWPQGMCPLAPQLCHCWQLSHHVAGSLSMVTTLSLSSYCVVTVPTLTDGRRVMLCTKVYLPPIKDCNQFVKQTQYHFYKFQYPYLDNSDNHYNACDENQEQIDQGKNVLCFQSAHIRINVQIPKYVYALLCGFLFEVIWRERKNIIIC